MQTHVFGAHPKIQLWSNFCYTAAQLLKVPPFIWFNPWICPSPIILVFYWHDIIISVLVVLRSQHHVMEFYIWWKFKKSWYFFLFRVMRLIPVIELNTRLSLNLSWENAKFWHWSVVLCSYETVIPMEVPSPECTSEGLRLGRRFLCAGCWKLSNMVCIPLAQRYDVNYCQFFWNNY